MAAAANANNHNNDSVQHIVEYQQQQQQIIIGQYEQHIQKLQLQLQQQNQQLQEQQQQLQETQLKLQQIQKTHQEKSIDLCQLQHNSNEETAESQPMQEEDKSNPGISNWQTVTIRRVKRKMAEDESPTNKHHSTTNVSTPTFFSPNIWQILPNDQITNNEESVGPSKPVNVLKPPPIFISNVTSVDTMIKTIDEAVENKKDSYIFKLIKCSVSNGNNFKITPSTAEYYRSIVNHLRTKKVAFHTYQLKQERAFRVVLRNMDSTIDLEELKAAIEENQHKVRNIYNIQHRVHKTPLPMFFVDLEPDHNNTEIYKLDSLRIFGVNAKIKFEPPRKKREIVQCKRCQQFNHTWRYCDHPYRCVKCGQNHETTACKKSKETPPQCANCGDKHPANYKGCEIYQHIRNKKYQIGTKSPSPQNEQIAPTSEHQTVRLDQTQQRPRTNIRTYAQAVNSSNNDNSENIAIESSNTTQLSQINHGNQSSIEKMFEKFEQIFNKQSEQINLLLNLISKILK